MMRGENRVLHCTGDVTLYRRSHSWSVTNWQLQTVQHRVERIKLKAKNVNMTTVLLFYIL